MQDNKIQIIEALRGIAALSVCWFHLTNSYHIDGFVKASGQFGWLGLEIFFVISGFIIPYVLYKKQYNIRKDWGKFILKRLIRLEPPYLFSILLVLFLSWLRYMLPFIQGDFIPVTAGQLFSHLGYLTQILDYSWLNPVYWTLAYEFQFYLLVALLFPLLASSKRIPRWAVMIFLAVCSFIITSNGYLFGYIFLFLLGIITFQYYCNLIDTNEFTVLIIIVLAGLYFRQGALVTIVGLLSALAIYAIKIEMNRILLILGSISYSVYLLHVPVGGKVVNLGMRIIDNEFERLVLSVTALVITLIAAKLFYEIIEKPSLAWASRIRF